MPFASETDADDAAREFAAAYPEFFEAGPSSRCGGSWRPSLFALMVVDGVPLAPAGADLSAFPTLLAKMPESEPTEPGLYGREPTVQPDHDLPPPEPCPDCGSLDVEVVKYQCDGLDAFSAFHGRCRPCRHLGPLAHNRRAAIPAWNAQ